MRRLVSALQPSSLMLTEKGILIARLPDHAAVLTPHPPALASSGLDDIARFCLASLKGGRVAPRLRSRAVQRRGSLHPTFFFGVT